MGRLMQSSYHSTDWSEDVVTKDAPFDGDGEVLDHCTGGEEHHHFLAERRLLPQQVD